MFLVLQYWEMMSWIQALLLLSSFDSLPKLSAPNVPLLEPIVFARQLSVVIVL